jgi:hypothetical protein
VLTREEYDHGGMRAVRRKFGVFPPHLPAPCLKSGLPGDTKNDTGEAVDNGILAPATAAGGVCLYGCPHHDTPRHYVATAG